MKILLALLLLVVALSDSRAAGGMGVSDAWDDACRFSVYVCDGLSLPLIIALPLADNLNGVHVMGIVLINSGLRAKEPIAAYSTLVHEFVHYLQFRTQAGLTRCEQEAEAFAVKNLVLVERGRADLRRDRWRKHYGC